MVILPIFNGFLPSKGDLEFSGAFFLGEIFEKLSVDVTAGILTSGLTLLFIRSMRTGPRHWRARGHREIT